MSSDAKTAPDIKIGDVVRLNSGGPDSTVVGTHDALLTIAWMADGTAHKLTLPGACVRKRGG